MNIKSCENCKYVQYQSWRYPCNKCAFCNKWKPMRSIIVKINIALILFMLTAVLIFSSYIVWRNHGPNTEQQKYHKMEIK